MSTKHQCGLITVDDKGHTFLLDDFGCHHVFKVDDEPSEDPIDKARRHMCPKCGTGPWYTEYVDIKTARSVIAASILALLQACAVVPAPDTCFANYDHVSHPLLGKPFGPESEEGTIDSVGTTCRWERKQGRVFFESGLSYMWPDSDLYGDDLLFNSRVGVKIWEKQR